MECHGANHRAQIELGNADSDLPRNAAPRTYSDGDIRRRQAGDQLHETLMYDRIEEIFARGLHTFLTDLQKTCRSIGEHIARTYFYYATAV